MTDAERLTKHRTSFARAVLKRLSMEREVHNETLQRIDLKAND